MSFLDSLGPCDRCYTHTRIRFNEFNALWLCHTCQREELLSLHLEATLKRSRHRDARASDMLQFLRKYVEKGGLKAQVVTCFTCGTPLKVPLKGSTVTCGTCNTENRLRDIFERVEAVVGK